MAKKEIEHTSTMLGSQNMKSSQRMVSVVEPYELPEGWKWISIGECCEKAFSGKSPKYSKEETPYKIIGQQANQRYGIDLKFVKFGTQEYAEAQADFYYLQYNDVILNTLGTGSIGRSGIYKYHEKILTDGHPFVFRTGTKYSPDLLFYYLRLNEQEIINTANGSTNQKFLSLKTFSKFPIPLPPTLAEQQRIVNRIESMFAKLDEAKEKAQNVVDGFETRKAAILHKAFTGELTAKWRRENGVSDDSWEEKFFDSCIAKMQNGLSKRSGNEGEETIVLRLANMGEDDFDVSDLRTIKLTSKEKNNYSLAKNDVVMIRVNGSKTNVGRQLLVKNNKGWSFCDHIIRIQFETFCMPNYMVYFSHTKEYKDYVQDNMVSSAGQNTISRKGLSNLSLKVPTLPEQVEIVRILDIIIEKENKAKQAAEAVLEQIDLLKKSILARAFRGEL